MLTEEEKKAIDHELEHVATRQAACIFAMQTVQKNRGYLTDEGMQDISEYLELSRENLENVASFYNLLFRKPVGRHCIMMCDSVSCWILGSEKLKERIKEKYGIDFGETTEDNRFTLLPIQCLGTCDRAPAVIIDRDTHRDLDPDKLEQIMEQYS